MAEVRAAIDEADCFCFVVSPDSVESPVCREEAAHAAAANKRILPLLHRAVTDGLVPETVAAHNWIDLRHRCRLRRGLRHAGQGAGDRARAPARPHPPARSSQGVGDHGRDRSHLLRGSDLSQAEAWLASLAGQGACPHTGPNRLRACLSQGRFPAPADRGRCRRDRPGALARPFGGRARATG